MAEVLARSAGPARHRTSPGAIVSTGHFGDHAGVGDGVSELRIDVGPGYRVYYTLGGGRVVLLLCGGDKDGQERDIKRAKEMAAQME